MLYLPSLYPYLHSIQFYHTSHRRGTFCFRYPPLLNVAYFSTCVNHKQVQNGDCGKPLTSLKQKKKKLNGGETVLVSPCLCTGCVSVVLSHTPQSHVPPVRQQFRRLLPWPTQLCPWQGNGSTGTLSVEPRVG